MSSYSNDDVKLLSIVNMAKEFNLSCDIVDRKLFFIIFNTENERSAVQLVARVETYIQREISIFGYRSFILRS